MYFWFCCSNDVLSMFWNSVTIPSAKKKYYQKSLVTPEKWLQYRLKYTLKTPGQCSNLNAHNTRRFEKLIFTYSIPKNQSSNLNSHNMRIHSGENPFECIVCENTHRRIGSLNGHTLIHTGKNPFSACQHCQLTRSESNRLDLKKKYVDSHRRKTAHLSSMPKKAFGRE